jgi:hypothetical protein
MAQPFAFFQLYIKYKFELLNPQNFAVDIPPSLSYFVLINKWTKHKPWCQLEAVRARTFASCGWAFAFHPSFGACAMSLEKCPLFLLLIAC